MIDWRKEKRKLDQPVTALDPQCGFFLSLINLVSVVYRWGILSRQKQKSCPPQRNLNLNGGAKMPIFGPPDVDKLSDKRDVKGLTKAWRYPKSEWVRCQATIALGWIGDARAVEPLIAALKDENERVCEAAAKALKQLRAACAVELLIPALKDERWWMRKMVAEILGSIRDSRAVEPLIAMLTDKQESATAAAMALGEIGDARAVKPLILALNDHNMRKVAAEALGKISDPRAMEELVAVLGDKDKARQCVQPLLWLWAKATANALQKYSSLS